MQVGFFFFRLCSLALNCNKSKMCKIEAASRPRTQPPKAPTARSLSLQPLCLPIQTRNRPAQRHTHITHLVFLFISDRNRVRLLAVLCLAFTLLIADRIFPPRTGLSVLCPPHRTQPWVAPSKALNPGPQGLPGVSSGEFSEWGSESPECPLRDAAS